MNLQKITVLAASFSLGCIASAYGADIAPGDEVTLSYQTSGPANVVRTSFVFGASSDATNRSSTSRGRAGMIHWLGGSKSFCVQVQEHVGTGDVIDFTYAEVKDTPENFSSSGGMGELRATMIADLYSRWYDSVKVYGPTGGGEMGRDMCAAFQAMIWEITHETLGGGTEPQKTDIDALNLAVGAMQVNDMTLGAMTYFEAMKESLGGGGSDWIDRMGGTLWGLQSGDYQDQLIVVPGIGVAFAGLGLVGIRRRRNR
jgi:hypothetical protein